MAKPAKERTEENIQKEIEELKNKNFNQNQINIILKIEEKLNKFYYGTISNKLTVEQLREIKDFVYNNEVPKNSVPVLFYAVQKNIDINNLKLNMNPTAVKAYADEIISDSTIKNYLDKYINEDTNAIQIKFLSQLIKNNIKLPDEFLLNQYNEFRMTCITAYFHNIKTREYDKYILDLSLNENNIVCASMIGKYPEYLEPIITKNFNRPQLQTLTKAITSKINVIDLLDPNIEEEKMKIFIEAKLVNRDMSKYYYTKHSVKQLKILLKALKEGIDISLIDDCNLQPSRMDMIFRKLVNDKNKYDISPLLNTNISDDIAEAIYVLQKEGYTVTKNKELER